MSQQYKLPFTGQEIEEKLENTILTPITASVGQTVKISAVDANGKPTAWEAVDFSEGGITSTYTNQLPLATDIDRTTVYDGNGYIDGYRLSSSGGISAQDGMSATGFIPATPGQTIRIKGATPMQGKNNYIIAYKADNTVSKYASMAYDSTGWITPHDGWMKYENGVIIILLTSTMFGSDFNAVRFCSTQLSDDVIVTVDEKIIDAIPTITTASVGQTIKVSAIDENGRPTAWEAVNLEEVWELLADVTLEEEVKYYEHSFDVPQKKLKVIVDSLAASDNTSHSGFNLFFNTDPDTVYKADTVFYPFPIPQTSAYRSVYNISTYYIGDEPCVDVDVMAQPGSSYGTDGNASRIRKYNITGLKDRYKNNMMVPEIIKFSQNTYGTFAAGTRYRIYGVKA